MLYFFSVLIFFDRRDDLTLSFFGAMQEMSFLVDFIPSLQLVY